jgi:signal transduction histidine kinase
MKTCSGGEPGLKLRTDVNELIRDVLVICNSQCARIDKVATDLDPGLPAVIVSPFDLSQAILNLLMNAIQAVLARPAGADPTPGLVAIATALAGDWVEIRIEDNGTGMTPEIKSRIFDQFFSTRQIGSGTGLGLPYAQSVIVQHHRGELDFESEPGRGTTFRIRLPIEERPGDEGPEAGSLESAHEAGRPGATGVENLEF